MNVNEHSFQLFRYSAPDFGFDAYPGVMHQRSDVYDLLRIFRHVRKRFVPDDELAFRFAFLVDNTGMMSAQQSNWTSNIVMSINPSRDEAVMSMSLTCQLCLRVTWEESQLEPTVDLSPALTLQLQKC